MTNDIDIVMIHRKTNERVKATRYVQGMYPPPKGVKVVHGLRGVLARVSTIDGDHQVINDGDWLLTFPGGHRDLFTDRYVHANYHRHDEPGGPAKPQRLG